MIRQITITVLFLCSMSVQSGIAQSETKPFPYQLKTSNYILLPASAAAFTIASVLYYNRNLNLLVSEIEQLNRNQINAFDRPATYNWNLTLNKTSDIMAMALPLLPAIVFIPQVASKKYHQAFTYATMGCEVFFITGALTTFTKTYSGRVRPYLYNTDFSASERFNFQDNEASKGKTSFYSGHTTAAFAASVFFSETYTKIYGKSWISSLIWGSTLTAAAFTGYTRVAAGEHFTTDVLTGAAIGSAMGYLIPKLHEIKSNKVSFLIMPQQFWLCYRI